MKKLTAQRWICLLLALLMSCQLVCLAAWAEPGDETDAAETTEQTLPEDGEQTEQPEDSQPTEDEPAEETSAYQSYAVAGAPEYEANCGAALLIELNSGTVIYGKNAEDIMYPASLTKIMTCMLAIEYGKLDDVITVSETALQGLDEAGSTAGLQPGEQLTLKDVLYCLMLSSANEACNVVAEYISSDVPSFVALMNKTAQELGCKNTHFANPHGLHESDHYTTAMDLSLITRKALGSETFREISGCAEYTVPATNLSEPRNLKTTNYLISTATVADYYYPDAIGIKTGYTSAAGRCVISRAADGNLNLLCVIMNATTDMLEDGSVRYNNFIEARKLFDYGFDNFAYAQVLTRLQPTAQVPVRYGRENKGVVLIPSKDINCVLPKDYDKTQVTTQYQLDTPELEAPLTQGQKVGNISVYYGGQKIGETTIETLTAVEASGTAKAFEESKNFLEEYWWLIAGLVGLIVLLLLVIWLRLVVHRARRRRAMRKRRPGGSRK